MQLSPLLNDLSKAENIQQLAATLAELAEQLDYLYTTTAPNGAISARQGRRALYKNGSTYEEWVNTDGSTTWQRVDYGAYTEPFKTGDWIISSVTTARTDWTNKSATYADKFMRINATPLTTGGADTVTLSEANLPSHTHAAGTLAAGDESAHTHTINAKISASGFGIEASFGKTSANPDSTLVSNAGSAHTHTLSGSTGAIGSGTAFSTVSAYVTVTIFQKD